MDVNNTQFFSTHNSFIDGQYNGEITYEYVLRLLENSDKFPICIELDIKRDKKDNIYIDHHVKKKRVKSLEELRRELEEFKKNYDTEYGFNNNIYSVQNIFNKLKNYHESKKESNKKETFLGFDIDYEKYVIQRFYKIIRINIKEDSKLFEDIQKCIANETYNDNLFIKDKADAIIEEEDLINKYYNEIIILYDFLNNNQDKINRFLVQNTNELIRNFNIEIVLNIIKLKLQDKEHFPIILNIDVSHLEKKNKRRYNKPNM